MKKLIAIAFLSSCQQPECPRRHLEPMCEYQFYVTDDSVDVFDYGRHVGTIKLDGSLDSLIVSDNL